MEAFLWKEGRHANTHTHLLQQQHRSVNTQLDELRSTVRSLKSSISEGNLHPRAVVSKKPGFLRSQSFGGPYNVQTLRSRSIGTSAAGSSALNTQFKESKRKAGSSQSRSISTDPIRNKSSAFGNIGSKGRKGVISAPGRSRLMNQGIMWGPVLFSVGAIGAAGGVVANGAAIVGAVPDNGRAYDD